MMEPSVKENIAQVRSTLPDGVDLVCVSKYKTEHQIRKAYEAGERDFGESHAQELLLKHDHLPPDIRWHFIGHLQRNKVRSIVPFVSLIHSVDSERLLQKISDEAVLIDRVIDVLLEVHIAEEETKTGFSPPELRELFDKIDTYSATPYFKAYPNVQIRGVMCMATNTDDEAQIRREFRQVAQLTRELFDKHRQDTRELVLQQSPITLEEPILSMGMSDDYQLAIEEGSTMVRVGSAIFGVRT